MFHPRSLREQVEDWTQVALWGRGLMEVQEREHHHDGGSQQRAPCIRYQSKGCS